MKRFWNAEEKIKKIRAGVWLFFGTQTRHRQSNTRVRPDSDKSQTKPFFTSQTCLTQNHENSMKTVKLFHRFDTNFRKARKLIKNGENNFTIFTDFSGFPWFLPKSQTKSQTVWLFCTQTRLIRHVWLFLTGVRPDTDSLSVWLVWLESQTRHQPYKIYDFIAFFSMDSALLCLRALAARTAWPLGGRVPVPPGEVLLGI